MTIGQHLTHFDNKRAFDYNPGAEFDPSKQVPRVGWSWEAELPFEDILRALIEQGTAELEALIIGPWDEELYDVDASAAAQLLIDNVEAFPKLRALFLGDITYEESEISWLHNTDLAPLLHAFPNLETFGTRGGNGLRFTNLQHDNLTSLTIQAGGLPSTMLNDLLQAKLPNLTHLELWLGTPNYGFDGNIDTLKPFLHGNAYPELDYPFPKLDYLGLRNSSIADQIAATLHDSPALQQVSTLDLSMGTLSNAGADALLQIEDWGKLERLDVSESWIESANLIEKLNALPLDTKTHSQRYDGDDWVYVAVGE